MTKSDTAALKQYEYQVRFTELMQEASADLQPENWKVFLGFVHEGASERLLLADGWKPVEDPAEGSIVECLQVEHTGKEMMAVPGKVLKALRKAKQKGGKK